MKFRRYLAGVIVLWVVYAALTLLAPATHSIVQYRINLVQLNLLRVSFILPILLIWLAATYAVARFRHYSNLVAGSAEGPGFRKLTLGIFTLSLVVIVPSLVALVSNFYPESLVVEKWVSITRQYLTIILYLFAFWYLYQGSRELNRAMQIPEKYKLGYRRVSTVVWAVLLIMYSWAIFHNQFRTFSNDPLIKPTYFVPDWLIVSTIFIPYAIMWLWGGWTISNLHAFAHNVSGSVYRKAFLYLTWGITITVLLLIVLQFLSQASTLFGHSSLKAILILIYILIFVIALGYLFLARAARHLTTIEEV